MSGDPEGLSFDIATLHAAFAAGTTAADVIAEVYRRIATVGDPGIFIHLRPLEECLAEASALPDFDPLAYPLWGIPFALKDNIDLAGTATTAGCPAYAYEPDAVAVAVAVVRAAGALPVGKTNLDQFATGLVGIRSPYPPPRNALDDALVPGGSSSGSAVAVAHGIVSFALGTDTAGSGRVPAAFNNIVGLKPTLGAISGTGVVPACRTVDTVSVFALTMFDAWRVFRTAAGHDAADAFSRSIAVPPLVAPPPSITIGVPNAMTREFFGDTVQAASFDAALERLAALGAQIVELDFSPFLEAASLLYGGAWVAERLGVVETLMRNRPEALHPVTRQVIGSGARHTAVGAFRDAYRLAELRRKAAPLLARVDLLCVPSVPALCTLADLEADPVGPNSRLGTYTNFVNLMDLCAVTVPTGPRMDALPGSVTLIAEAGRDLLAAAVGWRLHAAAAPYLGATRHPVPATTPPPAGPLPGETALAVAGAHMSGLPLNRELTSRDGRYLYSATTGPAYRLFALTGGTTPRPGMLRCSPGAEIELEIWALPSACLGDFLVSVPPPLSIGTIALSDGSTVKGFLVEHAGTDGAQDITGYGGWRAYLRDRPQAPGKRSARPT
ncbi:MAG: allophanate hydrolase [Alphaproteobacteria bacterium]|nr:allophanate hydrolase [Alphaproteobacteria bacterium]